MAELTLATFAPLVGTTFTADGGALRVPLVLDRAEPLPAPPGDRGRPPFTLEFVGPGEPALAQQTLPLDHDTLGRVDIFVVPVGVEEAGVRYHAVFS